MEYEPEPREDYEPAPRRQFGVILTMGLFLYLLSCLSMIGTLDGAEGAYVVDAILFRFGLFFALVGLALLAYKY